MAPTPLIAGNWKMNASGSMAETLTEGLKAWSGSGRAELLICPPFPYLGPVGAIWLLALIAALTLREFFALIRSLGIEPFDRVGIALALLICLSPLYLEPLGVSSGAPSPSPRSCSASALRPSSR